MKNQFALWVVGGLAVVAVTLSSGSISSGSGGQGKDVVMLRCSTGSSFGVKAYEGSANAPARRADTCPEVLSLLLKEGFSIQGSGYPESGERDFVIFTLIR